MEHKVNVHQLSSLNDQRPAVQERQVVLNAISSKLSSNCTQPLTLINLDIDRLSFFNHAIGYLLGDHIIQLVYLKLKTIVAEDDLIFRIDGDEFILAIQRNEPLDPHSVINRIFSLFNKPISIDGQEYLITICMGIVSAPPFEMSADTLLTNGNIALYEAKKKGRNSYHFSQAKLHKPCSKRLVIESELYHAYQKEEFVIFYQPQVNIFSGDMDGIEALIRWQHPQKGIVSPLEFITIAEETGLIVPIGQWVLEQVCQQMKAWQERGHTNLKVSVNISSRQFQEPDFVQQVRNGIHKFSINPEAIILEITESMAMENVSHAERTLDELNQLGIQICMDDFGTGYSSLNYLKRFPIQKLKIDQGFIKEITNHKYGKGALASLIIAIAHQLSLDVIAEGVETTDQLEFLMEQKCNKVQGYLFSKPVPVEAIELMFNKKF